jgi:hypothetical protein
VQNVSRKRKAESEKEEPRKTRKIRKDYRQLADPFLSDDDEDDDDPEDESEMIIMMAEAGDEFQTLREA